MKNDLENYCINLQHIVLVHYTSCFSNVFVRFFFKLWDFDQFCVSIVFIFMYINLRRDNYSLYLPLKNDVKDVTVSLSALCGVC